VEAIMQRARAFFYVCAGVLLLALSYHFGATTATAQAPGNPVVGIMYGGGTSYLALTANGDAYLSGDVATTWAFKSNVFRGSTPASQPTWGQVKGTYRK
jgi:hypothetical protein